MKNFSKTKRKAAILKALGNAKRLETVYILRSGEKKVSELEKYIGISQSALSQHLTVLRTAGIVSARRVAQSVYYSLSDIECRKLVDFLDKIYA